MRSMIVCLALIASAPLAACAATGNADQTAAKASPASDSAFQASRARAVRDGNTAVDRSSGGR